MALCTCAVAGRIQMAKLSTSSYPVFSFRLWYYVSKIVYWVSRFVYRILGYEVDYKITIKMKLKYFMLIVNIFHQTSSSFFLTIIIYFCLSLGMWIHPHTTLSSLSPPNQPHRLVCRSNYRTPAGSLAHPCWWTPLSRWYTDF